MKHRVMLAAAMVMASGAAGCERATERSSTREQRPVVTLTTPGGATGRAPLRLHPTAGAHMAPRMTMRMTVEGRMGPTQIPRTTMPPIAMTFSVDAVAGSGDDGTDVRFAYVDSEVIPDGASAPALIESLRSSMSKLNGIGGTGHMTTRGDLTSFRFEIPDSTPPETAQLMTSLESGLRQLAPVLPEEPIAVGAEWQVRQRVRLAGILTELVGTYKMTDRTGDRVSLDVSITSTAKPQKVTMPGVPAGVDVRLSALRGESKGKVVLDLRGLMTEDAHITGSSTVSMDVKAVGETISVEMSTDLDLRIEPGTP